MNRIPIEMATLQLAMLKEMAETEPEKVLRICCTIDHMKERIQEQDTNDAGKDVSQVIDEIREYAMEKIK